MPNQHFFFWKRKKRGKIRKERGSKMIYLDYSATTPVEESVLNSYIETTKKNNR